MKEKVNETEESKTVFSHLNRGKPDDRETLFGRDDQKVATAV